MKQALTISTVGHLSLALLLLAGSLLFRQNARNVYPTVYRINLVSLPRPSVQEAAEPTLSEPEQARTPPRLADRAKTSPARPRDSGSASGLPRGMKVVSVDGLSAEGSYYLGLILQKISRHWRNPYQGQAQEVRAQIFFRLTREGELLEASVEKSSGDGPFDQAALRAVLLAKPFPPFPPEMRLATLGVHFEFEYIK